MDIVIKDYRTYTRRDNVPCVWVQMHDGTEFTLTVQKDPPGS